MFKFHNDVVRSKNVKKSHEGQERSGKVRKGQERSGREEGRKCCQEGSKGELRSKMESSVKINKG
jgi:hypothetical protein